MKNKMGLNTEIKALIKSNTIYINKVNANYETKSILYENTGE